MVDKDLSQKLTDGEINEITLQKLGKWPSFEAQSWACKVVRAVQAQPAKGQVPEGWRTELEKIRDAIAAAPIDALGTGESPDCPPWPIRDEVVDGLTKLLAAVPAQEGGES